MKISENLGLVAAGALVLALVYVAQQPDAKPPIAGSSVKVDVENGAGSGVHIGGGNVLTAWHVVEDYKTAKLKTEAGDTIDAEVMWRNQAYDVALLRIEKPELAASPLRCDDPAIGEEISTIGNPLDAEFIRSWGKVASTAAPRKPGAEWKSAYLADITVSWGMSGGGVFDRAGRVVGLLNGIGLESFPQHNKQFAIHFGYVVPGSVVCKLLGRA